MHVLAVPLPFTLPLFTKSVTEINSLSLTGTAGFFLRLQFNVLHKCATHTKGKEHCCRQTTDLQSYKTILTSCIPTIVGFFFFFSAFFLFCRRNVQQDCRKIEPQLFPWQPPIYRTVRLFACFRMIDPINYLIESG